MRVDDRGCYGIERVYSDPSAAHERGLRFQAEGAIQVVIEPVSGSYVVTGWFRTAEEATTRGGTP